MDGSTHGGTTEKMAEDAGTIRTKETKPHVRYGNIQKEAARMDYSKCQEMYGSGARTGMTKKLTTDIREAILVYQ